MANEKMKYDLDTVLKKIQLAHNLTQEEQVFYIIEALDMKKKDAQRMLHLATHEEPWILKH